MLFWVEEESRREEMAGDQRIDGDKRGGKIGVGVEKTGLAGIMGGDYLSLVTPFSLLSLGMEDRVGLQTYLCALLHVYYRRTV